MKKIILIGVVGLALLIIGMVVTSNKPKSEETAEKSNTETSTVAEGRKACELLPLAAAQELIGSNAVLVEDESDASNAATTQDVQVDNCTYSAEGPTLGDLKQIVFQIHHGNSSQVKQAYENYKKDYPGDALPELGTNAYYATEANQVNVYEGSDWFFVGAGSINAGDEANKQMAIDAAKKIQANIEN